MKVSLICTVKNEEKTIEDLLTSIKNQTKVPDEIIFVDGGSSDKTVQILNKWKKKLKNLKIIEAPECNIAVGRNIAIKNASNGIIAVTDGGCILDKKWIENITKPFPNADVVSGVYIPLSRNDFEYFQGLIVCPEPEKINTPSRMSSRSIVFKKSCWKKVGGYPENLYTGEDTLFNIKLQKKGCKFRYVKDAIVKWRMRPNWKGFAKQFYLYGVGDRKSGNILKLKKNLFMVIGFWLYLLLIPISWFFSPLLSLSLISIGLLYFICYGIYISFKSRKLSGLFYGSLLYFLKRISYILGVSLG